MSIVLCGNAVVDGNTYRNPTINDGWMPKLFMYDLKVKECANRYIYVIPEVCVGSVRSV